MSRLDLQAQIELRKSLLAQIAHGLVFSQRDEALTLRNRRERIRVELAALTRESDEIGLTNMSLAAAQTGTQHIDSHVSNSTE